MSLLSKIKGHFSGTYQTMRGLVSDEVVSELDLKTAAGTGCFVCQVRQNTSGDRYVTFKSKGGDATVFVQVESAAVRQLQDFMRSNFPQNSTV